MGLTSKLKSKWSAGAGLVLTLSLIGGAQAEPAEKQLGASAVTNLDANPAAVPGQRLSFAQLKLLNLIYPPNSAPAGRSFRRHAADWEKWALTQPAESSPLLDTTGEDCARGQTTPGVWYLAGTFSADGSPVGPVTRSCTIPLGRVVVFPVVNAAYGAFPEDPPEQRTEEFVRDTAEELLGQPTGLSATLDGVAINVPSYLVESALTRFTLPEDNIYGIPGPQELNPFADKGYYLAFRLDPFSFLFGSTHVLKFKGNVAGFQVDVTYNLKVGLPG